MGLVHEGFKYVKSKKKIESKEVKKEDLLSFLEKLKKLESRLWGVLINDFSSQEEIVLEGSNHLIYLLGREKHADVENILVQKDFQEFIVDMEKLKEEVSLINKLVKEEGKLRDLISQFSIRLVGNRNYNDLEELFVLESQLLQILELQELQLEAMIHEIRSLKVTFDPKLKVEILKDYLVRTREVLAGHMEHHKFWEEERQGFSNTSNIISAIIKIVKNNS